MTERLRLEKRAEIVAAIEQMSLLELLELAEELEKRFGVSPWGTIVIDKRKAKEAIEMES